MVNFRKRTQILPGVKLNISKRGISTTFGDGGASVSAGSNGTYLNTSIPGTGLYNRQKISSKQTQSASTETNVIAIAIWIAILVIAFITFVVMTI